MNGLSVEGLTVHITGTRVLHNLAFTLPTGSFAAVVGPNGAGKTTLLRAIAGIQSGTVGTTYWHGTNILSTKPRWRARKVAFVEQDTHTENNVTVEQVVALGRIPHRPFLSFGVSEYDKAVETALEMTRLTALAQRKYASLSGGQRQRVHLARAIAQQPELLILDEPTNHLDPKIQLSTFQLLQHLQQRGVTIVMAIHDLSLALAYCSHVIIVQEGQVHSFGETEDVLTESTILDVYGVRAELLIGDHSTTPVFALSLAENLTRLPII